MRIGVIGHNGRIGSLLVKHGGIPVPCDIKYDLEVKRAIYVAKPDIVVLCACRSNIDYCEKPENQKEVVEVNLRGAGNVARICESNKIPMIFLSTDHIFDGRKGNYKENSKDKNPVNFYGLSKLAGEAMVSIYPNVKIVRTSKVFDLGTIDFVEYTKRPVPNFIFRSYIYSEHFVLSLLRYVSNFTAMPKVLNLTGNKVVSYLQFTREVLIRFGYNPKEAVSRKEYIKTGIAPRPMRAGLNASLSKKLGFVQHDYKDGIFDMHTEFLIRTAK